MERRKREQGVVKYEAASKVRGQITWPFCFYVVQRATVTRESVFLVGVTGTGVSNCVQRSPKAG